MTKKQTSSEVAQVGRFGLVGILNTIVDFVGANILTIVFHTSIVFAGVVSGTIAMINSFVFNQRFTFRAKETEPKRIVYFFIITAFGLYVIRWAILKLLSEIWLWPAEFVYKISDAVGLPFNAEFIMNNFAIAVSILVVFGYNYVMYKKFVFQK